MPTRKVIAIVAIWREKAGKNEVLVTHRPEHLHMGGCWELPGGKVEPGESEAEAAARELAEETGLVVAADELALLGTVDHDYPDVDVRLTAFMAKIDGSASADTLRTPLRWVDAAALSGVPFPAGNASITAWIVQALAPKAIAPVHLPAQQG